MMVIMVMMVMEAHAPVTCLSYPQPSEACLELMVLCLRCIEAIKMSKCAMAAEARFQSVCVRSC